MKLENGYKVIYEVAADGKRAFYASKSISYPNRDEKGNIVDFKMAEFEDKNYKGKVIYEYKGKFYVSVKSLPSYDENGIPTDALLVNEANFNEVFKVKEEVKEEEPADPETGKDPVDPEQGEDNTVEGTEE
jgi:hypothetical protein